MLASSVQSLGFVMHWSICVRESLNERLRHGSTLRDFVEKVRGFMDLHCGGHPWDRERRMIAEIEHGRKGANARFIRANLEDEALQPLHDTHCCAGREMENRSKDQQPCLLADCTRCHARRPNQSRLSLSSLAYVLMEIIRRLAIKGSELVRVQVTILRFERFKIGAVIARNARRVRLMLSSAYPHQEVFRLAAARPTAG